MLFKPKNQKKDMMRFCSYVYKASRKVYDFIIHVPDFTKPNGMNGSGVKTMFSVVHKWIRWPKDRRSFRKLNIAYIFLME